MFPPPAAVADIESIRARWDPVMAARIAAHLTIVHDVVDRRRADAALAAVAAATRPFPMRLTEAARWGPARGIYLRVEDPACAVAGLHDALAPVENPGWLRHGFRPHVTVVHGRYVTAADAEAAWRALNGWTVDREVLVDRVAVAEMDTDGWITVDEVPLLGG